MQQWAEVPEGFLAADLWKSQRERVAFQTPWHQDTSLQNHANHLVSRQPQQKPNFKRLAEVHHSCCGTVWPAWLDQVCAGMFTTWLALLTWKKWLHLLPNKSQILESQISLDVSRCFTLETLLNNAASTLSYQKGEIKVSKTSPCNH